MGKFEWQEGLKEKIDALCAIFPPIIKDRWRNRLIYNAEKISAYEGSASVTADIFWRSVGEVFPGGYEPLILQVKDPEKLKAAMLSSKDQENMEPGKEPVTITRWSQSVERTDDVPPGKKILVVNSSARKGGNTDVILDELVRACKDNGSSVEKIYLCDLDIKQCTGCRACRKRDVKTICAIKDDMIHAGANYVDQEVVVGHAATQGHGLDLATPEGETGDARDEVVGHGASPRR